VWRKPSFVARILRSFFVSDPDVGDEKGSVFLFEFMSLLNQLLFSTPSHLLRYKSGVSTTSSTCYLEGRIPGLRTRFIP